jgi:3-phosphoshikimate 1-carboxyvinyltransferase
VAALTTTVRVTVPGDKSVSHRALIFAALATGVSRIDGILDSADVRSTAGVLRELGVDLPAIAPVMPVRGVGLRGLRVARRALDCGNSGTTTRLMAGVLAAYPFASDFVGDASLSRRPMARVAEPLRAMGARVTLSADGTLPMRVDGGALHGIAWHSTIASAQVKSAILLAGLVAGVPVTVVEPTPSRDHTERFLQALSEGKGAAASLRSFTLAVPRDPSSAAFFAAFAAIGDGQRGTVVELPNVLASPTRDGFFRALSRMGARVESEPPVVTDAGEAVTTYRVSGGRLQGITVGGGAGGGADDVTSMIDEIPLLACVAAVADGETRVTGASELRVKESDRIANTVANLRAIGAEAEELRDGLVVRGEPGRPLRGRVLTHGDHRIAMAFAILGARRGNAIEVDDPACVGVSYPGFWDDLRRVAR